MLLVRKVRSVIREIQFQELNLVCTHYLFSVWNQTKTLFHPYAFDVRKFKGFEVTVFRCTGFSYVGIYFFSNWVFVCCCFLFGVIVPLENLPLMEKLPLPVKHIKSILMLGTLGHWKVTYVRGCLACHTYCDTAHASLRSSPWTREIHIPVVHSSAVKQSL